MFPYFEPGIDGKEAIKFVGDGSAVRLTQGFYGVQFLEKMSKSISELQKVATFLLLIIRTHSHLQHTSTSRRGLLTISIRISNAFLAFFISLTKEEKKNRMKPSMKPNEDTTLLFLRK